MTVNQKVPARKRGRPPALHPRRERRVLLLTAPESRRLNSWMRKNGHTIDSEALLDIVLNLLDREGIKDPGSDSEEGTPPEHLKRKSRPAAPPVESSQLALTA